MSVNAHGESSRAFAATSTSSTASTSNPALFNSPDRSFDSQDGGKRNRYQYSCLQCQRRKQRCSRNFPCEKCTQRGIAHLCSPPSNLHRPSRRIRMRQKLAMASSDQDPSSSQQELEQEQSTEDQLEAMDDTNTYDLYDDHRPTSSRQATSHLVALGRLRSGQTYLQQPQHDIRSYQHCVQQHSPQRYQHAESHQHRRSQSSYQGHPHPEVSPVSSSLASSRRMVPDAISSPNQGPEAFQGENALAQLATVAQWPSLHQQERPEQQKAATGAINATPSTLRSKHSVLEPDQRSMVDADDAFIGKPALNGLGWNPFRRHEGVSTDLLSWTGQLGRGFGLVIPKYELRSVQQSLPSKAEAARLLQIYLDDFNWSRFPSSAQEVTKAVEYCVERCPISDDVQMLPLMAFCLSIFGLATLDLAVRPYPTRPSRTYFFAARKALSLSESLGLHTLDSLSASLNLCRYLDLCRVPRSTWLQVASCMRGAIDLGLHLHGAYLGQNCSATLQRRVLWSHIVHQDREWSVLFGRPMTEIPFSTTPSPSLQDYLSLGLELACAQYLVVRDAFRVFIERISRLFQEIAASSNSSPSSRIYERALEIDRDIVDFTESLPPCLSTSLSLSGGAMRHQDFSTIFYHHLCTNQVIFFRSLLHRPFWMESSDLISADKYKHSRQICVDLALSDLRGRRLLSRRIPVTMLCHLYGSAYSLLSMNTIIASDMLFALELGEDLQVEEVLEKLGYIQEYVATVRANIQESRGDHLAVKELYVMRSLLKRIQDKVATLNPQSVGYQVLGVRYAGGCADRLAMTLMELQSAANLLLNMARAGVRIDDATRIPPSGEDRALSSLSNPSSGPSPEGTNTISGQPMPQSQSYSAGDDAVFAIESSRSAGSMSDLLNPLNGNVVTPSAESLDLFLANADDWLSSLLNPGAAAFSAPTQPLDLGFSLF
ncbi:hypothetical protein NDA14_004137 [Ustilago hordei]|nr:hypothetical protein NDA14_004137 [Ustilago hordei]